MEKVIECSNRAVRGWGFEFRPPLDLSADGCHNGYLQLFRMYNGHCNKQVLMMQPNSCETCQRSVPIVTPITSAFHNNHTLQSCMISGGMCSFCFHREGLGESHHS